MHRNQSPRPSNLPLFLLAGVGIVFRFFIFLIFGCITLIGLGLGLVLFAIRRILGIFNSHAGTDIAAKPKGRTFDHEE